MSIFKKLFGKGSKSKSPATTTQAQNPHGISIGMKKEQVIKRLGYCKNISTMSGAAKKVDWVGDQTNLNTGLELWGYDLPHGNYKIFFQDGKVDEVRYYRK